MDPNQKTDSQLETEEALQAGQQQSDSISQSSNENSSKLGAAAGAASKLSGVTPAGKLAKSLGFLSKHKKGVATGGGLLGLIVTMVIIFMTLSAPVSTILAVGSLLDQFNFGPGDRNIVGQVRHIKSNINTIRGGNTELSRKVNNIEGLDRAMATNDQTVMRHKKRFNFRSLVSSRAPRATWRGTLSRTSSPDGRASRRLYGLDADSRRSTSKDLGRGLTADELNRIAESDNPRAQARISGKAFVGNSILAGGLAAACVSSVLADSLPDEDGIYEMLLVLQSDFLSTYSQLADGDSVDSDQLVDLMDSLHFTEETIELSEDIPPEQIAEMERTLEEIRSELEQLDEDEAIAQREEMIGQNPNFQTGRSVRSFSHSEAYKYMTNLEVTGNEMDAGMTYGGMVDRLREGPAGYLLRTGDGINWLTVGLAPGACNFLLNPVVGWALTATDAITTVLACKATLGAGCGVRVALFGVTEALARGVSWAILSLTFNSLTPEGPEELFGYTNMGTNLAESEYARSLGAPPISNQQANLMREQHFALLGEEDRQQGFVWRYLSLQNPRSITTSLAVKNQLHFDSSQTVRTLTNFTGSLASAGKRLFLPARANNPEFHNYGIQQYGFTEEELRVDPLQNAQEVEEALRCARNTETDTDNCTNSKIAEGRVMDELLEKCIDPRTADPYNDRERICRNPNSSERRIWAKVGVWRLNNVIVDSLDCLSHDRPCGNELAAVDDEPPASGDITYPPNLEQHSVHSMYYKMPEAPNNEYVIYSSEARRYGQRELIGVLYTVALQYDEKFPDSKLYIGDLNAGAPHKSHRWGIAADIQACCNPRAAQSTRANYSREATVELGKLLVDTGLIKNIWYNDQIVNEQVKAYARSRGMELNMRPQPGHNNHFHIDLNIPRGPEHAP